MIKMEIVPDNHDDNILRIVLRTPQNLVADMNDYRYHLLFTSIARLGTIYQNISVYIVNSDETLFVIALLYIDPLSIIEVSSISEIISDPTITNVLVLDPYMFIQNPDVALLMKSPLYMNKMLIWNQSRPRISELNPLIESEDAIVKISNRSIADIYIHTRYLDVKISNHYRNIGISCLLIVTEKNKSKLNRCLACYQDQTHVNRELILVAPSSYKSFLHDISSPIIWHDGSHASMRNVGIKACKYDYVLRWNLGDWYHSSLLDIFADKSPNGEQDFISLGCINGYDGSKIVTSYQRYNGWEDILMIKRDKMIPYPDEIDSDTLHMTSQWERCSSVHILETTYASLYVKMNYKTHSLDVPVSPLLEKYYDTEILSVIPAIQLNSIMDIIPIGNSVNAEIVPYVSTQQNHWLWTSMHNIYIRITSYLTWPWRK